MGSRIKSKRYVMGANGGESKDTEGVVEIRLGKTEEGRGKEEEKTKARRLKSVQKLLVVVRAKLAFLSSLCLTFT